MTARKTLDAYVRDADDTFSCAYGPFTLRSVFQPIFTPDLNGTRIAGFHSLVRIERHGDAYAPREFLNAVDPRDLSEIDSRLAGLHALNGHPFARTGAKIHIPRDPRHFYTSHEMRADAEKLRHCTDAAGLASRDVVCELQMRDFDDLDRTVNFAAHLRRAGLLVAIDGYAGEERDLKRVSEVRPSFVRFDQNWLRGFLENSAGTALLRVIIRQLAERNILAIASGIDREEEVQQLERIQMPRIQGHALAKPDRAANLSLKRLGTGPVAVEDRQRMIIANPPPLAPQPVMELSRPPVQRRGAAVFGRRGAAG